MCWHITIIQRGFFPRRSAKKEQQQTGSSCCSSSEESGSGSSCVSGNSITDKIWKSAKFRTFLLPRYISPKRANDRVLRLPGFVDDLTYFILPFFLYQFFLLTVFFFVLFSFDLFSLTVQQANDLLVEYNVTQSTPETLIQGNARMNIFISSFIFRC